MTDQVSPIKRYNSRWQRYWQLLLFKTYTDLKVEREITYLGFLWWIIEPLFFLSIYYVVFGYVIKNNIPHFIEFLVVGVVVWRWFGPAMTRACRSINSHKTLLQEVYVSKLLFPVCEVLNDAVKFSLVFLIVLVILLLMHHTPGVVWLTIFPNLFCQVVLIFGLSFCFSAITPFVPDFPLIIQTIMMALMMVSGVFYDILHASAKVAFVLQLNPIADVIINYRLPLVYDLPPQWGMMLYTLAWGVALNVIGISMIRKNERVYPKV